LNWWRILRCEVGRSPVSLLRWLTGVGNSPALEKGEGNWANMSPGLWICHLLIRSSFPHAPAIIGI
jgi:hypothetical protein